MKYVLSIASVLTIISAQAQTFVTTRAGVNFSSLTSDIMDVEYRVSATGAIGIDHFFNDQFSVGAELFYNTRGYSDEIIFRDENNVYLGEDRFTVRYSYLSIPIKAGLTFGSKQFAFFNAGIMPSFFVTGSTLGPELNSNRPTGNKQQIKIMGDFPIDIAALLEAGAGYNFSRYALVASLMAQRSFRQLAKEPNETNMKHYGFGLSIGLRFKL